MKQTQELYHLPLSGQIIGEVFNALRIPYPTHLRKEMQRYFRGERVHDDTREEILFILVDVLLKDGILPYPHVFELAFTCHWGLRKQLVRGIREYAERWDSTCAKLRYWAIPHSRKEDLLVSCLRLATIDMALRLASFRYLSKLPLPEQAIPLWAKRGGNTTFLKRLKEQCADKPSNAELADAVGVANDKTKAGWFYKGRRLSRAHMQALAGALIARIPGTNEHDLLAEMNRHYALAALCEKLASRIGWDKVMELVGALYHQATRIQRFFEQETKPVEENYSHFLLHFILGAGRSFQALWLQYLWDTENDPEWKQDIVCVERDWVSRLFQVNLRFSDEGVLERCTGTNYLYINPYDKPPGGGYYGALLHRDDDGISAGFDYVSARYIDNKIDGEMALWGGAGWEAWACNWDKNTEDQFRLAIESNPDSARAHLDLGVFLGLHGCLPTHLEEGYQECIKAIELRPKWELPWIETANILLHAGDSERPLQLLNDATNNISRPSHRLMYTIAFAKMMNRDFVGALEMFENATRMKPDFAPAFENAAFCAFRLGENLVGRRYAKIARRLGISTTYDLYDVGKTKQKPNLIPFEILCETVRCPEKNCKDRAESEEIREQWRQDQRWKS